MPSTPAIVIPAGLEADPDIQAAMKSLALASIRSATDLLQTGAPSIQQQIVRMVLPQVTKALAQGTDDPDDELKSALDVMYGDVRRAIGGE